MDVLGVNCSKLPDLYGLQLCHLLVRRTGCHAARLSWPRNAIRPRTEWARESILGIGWIPADTLSTGLPDTVYASSSDWANVGTRT
jgi:hypothetical protein